MKERESFSWHFFCGAFYPQITSVGNYTLNLAKYLSKKNHNVHIWTKKYQHEKVIDSLGNLQVHRCVSLWDDVDFAKIDHLLENIKGDRKIFFLQYTPTEFGMSYHKKFHLWLKSRKDKNDLVWIMIHIPYERFSFTLNPKKWITTSLQRKFLSGILRFCDEVFIPAPYWETKVKKLIPSSKSSIHWLPLHSNIPCFKHKQKSGNLRKAFAPEAQILLGTFGSYFEYKLTKLLSKAIYRLLKNHSERSFLCLGRGSDDFVEKLKSTYPKISSQIESSGELDAEALSAHIQACDLMIQPYPYGVSTNRTSIMASLLHAKAVVTSKGYRTESIWEKSSCVFLYDYNDEEDLSKKAESLIYDSALKKKLGYRALTAYNHFFSTEVSVQKLLKLVEK